MNAKSTDEIICTNCGRPNLPEAVKCWYCQIPLEKESKSEEAVEEEAQAPAETAQTKEAPAVKPEEEIPDWLKRIRKLKEADHIDDDIEDQWQQQDLFNDPDDEAEMPHEAEHKRQGKAKSQPVEKKQPEVEKPAQAADPDEDKSQPALDMQEKQEEKAAQNLPDQDKTEEEPPSEDLPDGFVKFDSKSN